MKHVVLALAVSDEPLQLEESLIIGETERGERVPIHLVQFDVADPLVEHALKPHVTAIQDAVRKMEAQGYRACTFDETGETVQGILAK